VATVGLAVAVKLRELRESENMTILPVINWKFETAMNGIIWHHKTISEDCFL
jgi:hypothetical protein